MADSSTLGAGHHRRRSTTWSVEDDILRRRALETTAGSSTSIIPSNRLATNGTVTTTGSSSSTSLDHEKPQLASGPALTKSRSSLRHSRSMIHGARKAYPLPDPSQFVTSPTITTPTTATSAASSPASWDPTLDDILYPWQSFKRDSERVRLADSSKSQQQGVVTNPQSSTPSSTPASTHLDMGLKRPAPSLGTSSIHGGEKQPSSACMGLKQPAPPALVGKLPDVVAKPAQIRRSLSVQSCVRSSVRSSVELEPVLRSPPADGDVKKESAEKVPSTGSRVVVVYDGEMKFTTAPVDVALKSFATAEGDAIVVVAFLEHVMSPMGMKMVADLKQFSGVNESILKKTVLLKKMAIESTLRDTARSKVCELRKIQLVVKVLPGSNPKALVAKEIIGFQATCAIFDNKAIWNRKYYEENLSCRILKLRSDGRTVETISSFGQGVEKTSSTTSHCSDSSSDSSMNSDSPSLWSKLKVFGSRRSSLRLSAGGPGSVMGSSRTSSNLGSSGALVHEEDEPVAEVLDQSFSFDSPMPNPAPAYVYAAAGLDHEFG